MQRRAGRTKKRLESQPAVVLSDESAQVFLWLMVIGQQTSSCSKIALSEMKKRLGDDDE
jgi:hypothetical protein